MTGILQDEFHCQGFPKQPRPKFFSNCPVIYPGAPQNAAAGEWGNGGAGYRAFLNVLDEQPALQLFAGGIFQPQTLADAEQGRKCVQRIPRLGSIKRESPVFQALRG